jgi:uncharacterized protein with gpF-like domain
VLIKRELDKQCMALLKGEQPDEEKLKQHIRKLHNDAGITMAKYNYDKIRKSAGVKDSMTPEQRWAAVIKLFLEQGLTNLVNGITSTTKETIRKVLIKGMQEGWSITQMMTELEKSGINAYRAELIARTETTRAANQGALLGAVSTGLQTEKEWIAITDDRTRRIPPSEYDHWHMDGKTKPIDEPFFVPMANSLNIPGIVSGEEMQYPGDANGSAGNVCNCRCTVGFEVVRDSNGKPVDIQGGLRGPAGTMFNLWNNTLFLQLQTLINEALPG